MMVLGSASIILKVSSRVPPLSLSCSCSPKETQISSLACHRQSSNPALICGNKTIAAFSSLFTTVRVEACYTANINDDGNYDDKKQDPVNPISTSFKSYFKGFKEKLNLEPGGFTSL